MALKLSREHQEQNQLLGDFLSALQKIQDDIVHLAQAYKACVDANMDMSRYVSKRLGFRLTKIAEGKLLPEAHERLLGNDAMVETMTLLPPMTQKKLMSEGIAVWRDEKAQVIPFDEVMPSEARRLVDATGGQARILSPEEQHLRAVPRPPRHDKILDIRFQPDEYEQVVLAARKAGLSPAFYIKRQLALAGIIGKKKVR